MVKIKGIAFPVTEAELELVREMYPTHELIPIQRALNAAGNRRRWFRRAGVHLMASHLGLPMKASSGRKFIPLRERLQRLKEKRVSIEDALHRSRNSELVLLNKLARSRAAQSRLQLELDQVESEIRQINLVQK